MKKKTDQLFVSDILNFPMVAGPPKGGRVVGVLDDEDAWQIDGGEGLVEQGAGGVGFEKGGREE